jgi:CMP-N-acetylneuraminic acid synthetase
VVHAILEADKFYKKTFDVVLLAEPTSPLRKPEDLEEATKKLISSHADSVVAVSSLNSKCHPAKALSIKDDESLGFYEARGAKVINRQSLESLYWRNGVCYVFNRVSLLKNSWFFTENTIPFIIEREIVNIDSPIELEWAEFLLKKRSN